MNGREIIEYVFSTDNDIEDIDATTNKVKFLIDRGKYPSSPRPLPAKKHNKDGMYNYSKNISNSSRNEKMYSVIESDVFSTGWLLRTHVAIRYDSTADRLITNNKIQSVEEIKHRGSVSLSIPWMMLLPDGYDVLIVPPSQFPRNGVDVLPKYVDSHQNLCQFSIQLFVRKENKDRLNENIIHDGEPIAKVFLVRKDSSKVDAVIKTE